jgi:hypothetical protein
MNIPIQPLHRFDYNDLDKDRPLPCRCGFTAPGEIIEYYRFYHVLGCMRCQSRLAIVGHPVPVSPRSMDILSRWQEEMDSMVA